MTRGPLGKITMGFIFFMLFFCVSIFLFAYVSIRRDNLQTETMENDVPAIIDLYNSFINYPNFSSVEFTQDGEITLLNSELEAIGTMKVTAEDQVEVLNNVKKIYRDDYGVNFLYGNNFFSNISRVIFSQKSMEDIKNKRSENEVVTRLSNGMYMVVYKFDYERFVSPNEIKKQLNEVKHLMEVSLGGIIKNGEI